ncbi:hypothetical protein KM043_017744 [Ampulex compressa]|nr:hypothetical protein KM043_017744 [Ampulex compressa]
MEQVQELQPKNVLFFRLDISNSFKHIAESVSEEEFVEILSILKSNPNVARKLYKALIDELYRSMNDDLNEMLTEGSLQEGLAKISKLSENLEDNVPENVWRPPGNVSQHLRSLDAQKILEESAKLEKQVIEMENENAILMRKVAERRTKVNTVNDNVLRILNRSPIALERLGTRLNQLEKCFKLLGED